MLLGTYDSTKQIMLINNSLGPQVLDGSPSATAGVRSARRVTAGC